MEAVCSIRRLRRTPKSERRPPRAALLWGRALATFASGDLEEATRPFAKAKASPAPRQHTLRRTRGSVKLPRHARSLRAGAVHPDGTCHAPDPTFGSLTGTRGS